MLKPSHRPLRATEKRLLRAKIRSLERRSEGAPASVLLVAGAVFTVLWATTLALADAPFWVITGFWLAVGGAITTWVHIDLRRDLGAITTMVDGLQQALERNEAEVYDVRASSLVEFVEHEDEGACYAFQLEGDRMLFLCGQEFYPSARFPSLDFSIVYPLDEAGNSADMFIEKRGKKVTPARVLSTEERERHEILESLEVRPGRIDDL